MSARADHVDRLMHVLLEEQLGDVPAVDLSEAVLAEAFPASRARLWLRRTLDVSVPLAAAVLLAFLGWLFLQEDLFRQDAGWLETTKPMAAFHGSRAHVGIEEPVRYGAPGDGDPAREAPGARAFAGQLDIAFRIPERLPGDWTFRRAKALAQDRVQLLYRHETEEAEMSVFLWSWPGDDREAYRQASSAGDRVFTILRVRGLGVAFEGGRAEPAVWWDAATSFAARD